MSMGTVGAGQRNPEEPRTDNEGDDKESAQVNFPT